MRLMVTAGLRGSALSNARSALDELERSIAEREALQAAGHRTVTRLSREETEELLAAQTVGRVAYVARAGVPDVVPVNYAWCEDGVLFRSGPGPKLQAAQRGETVAFEVDEIDLESRTGRRAVVVGRARVVSPREAGAPVEPWASGPRRFLVLVSAERVEGRRLG